METWVSPITKWLLTPTAVTTSSSSSTTTDPTPSATYPDPTVTLPLSQPPKTPATSSITDLQYSEKNFSSNGKSNENNLGEVRQEGHVDTSLCFLKETSTHTDKSHPFKATTLVLSPPVISPKNEDGVGETCPPANTIVVIQQQQQPRVAFSDIQEPVSIHPLANEEPLRHTVQRAHLQTAGHQQQHECEHDHHNGHQQQHQDTSSDSTDAVESDNELDTRRTALRTIVHAIQWVISGPKANGIHKVKTNDTTCPSEKDRDSDDCSHGNHAKHSKRRKLRQSAKSLPATSSRPTISKTRLKVFVGTWNMMGQMPNIRDGLTGFLDIERQKEHQQQHPQQSSLDPSLRLIPSSIPTSNPNSNPSVSPLNLEKPLPQPPHPATYPLDRGPISATHSNQSTTECSTAVTPSPSQQSVVDSDIPAPPKPKKRRAGELLKRIRRPRHDSHTDLSSTPASPSSNERRREPDITSASGSAPGILKEPFLEMNSKAPYHIIAINTQECEREIREAVLFPSKNMWEKHLQTALGSDYVMIKTETMAALHIAVFIWKPIEDLVSAVDSSTVATGIGGIVGNKGAVAISVYLGSTSLLFVNAHLTAHQGNTQARNSDYKRIIQELHLNEAPKRQARGWHFKGDMKLRRHYDYPPVYLPKPGVSNNNNVGKNGKAKASSTANLLDPNRSPVEKVASSSAISLGHPQQPQAKGPQQPPLEVCPDVTEQFDYTFWAGDLNYRVDLSREKADECIQKGDLETMLAHDQLSIQKAAGAIFDGFMEAPIKFKPTYKFDPLVLIPTDTTNRPLRRNWTRTLQGRPLSMVLLQEPEMPVPSPAFAPTRPPLYRMENSKSCPSLLLDEHGHAMGLQSDDENNYGRMVESDTEENTTDGGGSGGASDERRHRRVARRLSVSRAIQSVRRRRSAAFDAIQTTVTKNRLLRRFSSDDLVLGGERAQDAAVELQGPLSLISLPCESIIQGQTRRDSGDEVMVVRPVRVQTLAALDQALHSEAVPVAACRDGANATLVQIGPIIKEQQRQQQEQERQKLLQMVQYDSSSKQRIPSWTDRILWKATGGNFYLPAEIGDDTRSENGNGEGGGRGRSLLRKTRSRVIAEGAGSPKTPGAGDDDYSGGPETGPSSPNNGFMMKLSKKRIKDSAAASGGEGSGKMSLLESLRMEIQSARSRSSRRSNGNEEGTSRSSSFQQVAPPPAPLMSEDDENRAAVLVKQYTAHHDVGLFSDHRPVTAVFAVRFDWKLTDRGGVIGEGSGLSNGLFKTKSHRTAGERWGPLDKVLERMQ